MLGLHFYSEVSFFQTAFTVMEIIYIIYNVFAVALIWGFSILGYIAYSCMGAIDIAKILTIPSLPVLSSEGRIWGWIRNGALILVSVFTGHIAISVLTILGAVGGETFIRVMRRFVDKVQILHTEEEAKSE
jgi:hypothetical protein